MSHTSATQADAASALNGSSSSPDIPRARWRNIILFGIGTYALSILGGWMMTGEGELAEAGGLPFILGPILLMVLLRTLGGDGWRDAGLGLKLRRQGGWYFFALLAYPLTFALVILLGLALGWTELTVQPARFFPLLVTGMAAQFIPRMILGMCEEWGWRGYLEPRLAALNVAPFRRHLLVGLIWAPWHFPLILATDYTEANLWLFLPLFTVGVVVAAQVYGRLRAASQTVWTSVLMHGIANTMAYALIENELVRFERPLLAETSIAGLLVIVIWVGLAYWLWQRVPSRK